MTKVRQGDRTESPERRWRRYYQIVSQVPEGRVATYGQIAALAGYPRHAREVGYSLAALPEESELPWQRVINARGEVSPRREPGRDGFQRHLLEEEGVVFGPAGRVDLVRFEWRPAVGKGSLKGLGRGPKARRPG